MNEQVKIIKNNTEVISLKEILLKVQVYWKYLLSKWTIIFVFCIVGSIFGLLISIFIKPKYTAHLSFALVEKSNSGGGLADLASSFGLGSMGSSGGAFSGDNLIEIIKSRHAIEQTLLTPVNYKGEKKNLVEVYIQFNNMRDAWLKSKDKEMQSLVYPLGQIRKTFTLKQDSILNDIYSEIVLSNNLSVLRKDKKNSIVTVDFTSKDELFSKLFVEKLMDETYQFYSDTRTSLSRANIRTMQHTADSIKQLYESALFRSAGYSEVNINPALQFAAVPKIKQENNAKLYATVYTEVLKNLETLKLDLAREKPLVQIIDIPRLPLAKERIGKVKGILIGGFLGGFMIVTYLLGVLYIKEIFSDKKD